MNQSKEALECFNSEAGTGCVVNIFFLWHIWWLDIKTVRKRIFTVYFTVNCMKHAETPTLWNSSVSRAGSVATVTCKHRQCKARRSTPLTQPVARGVTRKDEGAFCLPVFFECYSVQPLDIYKFTVLNMKGSCEPQNVPSLLLHCFDVFSLRHSAEWQEATQLKACLCTWLLPLTVCCLKWTFKLLHLSDKAC